MSIAKKIIKDVRGTLGRCHAKNVSIHYGKLNKHTVNRLKQEFKTVKQSFCGYWEFEI